MNFITRDILYTSGDIKREAKAQLRGRWKWAVLLAVIPAVFSVFFVGNTVNDTVNESTTSGLVSTIYNIIQGFLFTGIAFTLLDFIRLQYKENALDPLSGALSAFKRQYFLNLLLLKIIKNIYVFLWTLLLIVPGVVKSYGYSQAELIFKDTVDRTGEQPSPRECLQESERLMYGHKIDLFTLDLSFIGWYLVVGLTIGIASLWVTPYRLMSRVIFYENIGGYSYVEDLEDEAFDYPSEGKNSHEEVGKDPDDFDDFEDF